MPWKRIIGLRNILSHEYAAIDPEAIFNTIKIGIHLCSLL
ncbi:HepT-like ribonuclease domain-containing protein [Bacteroides faecis]